MDNKYTKVLLVSANVGSIFEDPEQMLQMWLEEFLTQVEQLQPGFLAIHCQEVGGKNYEESMQHVNSFCKSLLTATQMQPYDRARLFLDEDFTAVEQFTALGNLYFIHESVPNVSIFDFEESQFVPLQGREVLSGNIQNIPIKEKAKFPQEFFPDFKWSRKGFIRTRWNVDDSVFDLVNIHLFHDASNITAMESSPSQYSKNRERTLQYTLDRFENDKYDNVPIFLFGDFNFRLDTCDLVKHLTKDCSSQQQRGKKNDVCKCVYTQQKQNKVVLTVEKKGFEHHQHKEMFSNNIKWLREFDAEPQVFGDRLHEFEITFPPSYPFSEDVKDGTSYMKTRCPAWCDRIMFTPSSRKLMLTDENLPEYRMMGPNICMGDHKPIILNLKLRQSHKGNISTPVAPPHSDTSQTSLVPPESVPPACDTSPSEHNPTPMHKQPLKKVISINGEEVEVSSLHDFNIHDFASFEGEEHITRKFMSTIRRKGESLDRKSSFKDVVKDVMRAERIMRALRHYSHRSDSEHEDTEDEMGHVCCNSLSEEREGASGDFNANEKKVEIDSSGNVNIQQVTGDVFEDDDNESLDKATTTNPAPTTRSSVNNNNVASLCDLNSPATVASVTTTEAAECNPRLSAAKQIITKDHSPPSTLVDLLPDNNNLLPSTQKKTASSSDINDVTVSLANEKTPTGDGDSPKRSSMEVVVGAEKQSTKCHKCCVVM